MRHGPHHVAQRFITTTLPDRSESFNDWPSIVVNCLFITSCGTGTGTVLTGALLPACVLVLTVGPETLTGRVLLFATSELLQLAAPNAARAESIRTVSAARTGVQNFLVGWAGRFESIFEIILNFNLTVRL